MPALRERLISKRSSLAVLAVYPVGQTGNMETASYVDCAEAKPLNKAMLGWLVDKLVTAPAETSVPRLDWVNANLKNLPPVILINAEIDPLRTDGELLEAAVVSKAKDAHRRGGHTSDYSPTCLLTMSLKPWGAKMFVY